MNDVFAISCKPTAPCVAPSTNLQCLIRPPCSSFQRVRSSADRAARPLNLGGRDQHENSIASCSDAKQARSLGSTSTYSIHCPKCATNAKRKVADAVLGRKFKAGNILGKWILEGRYPRVFLLLTLGEMDWKKR